MKITPTQDEDVIEQTTEIELPKSDMPLEDYILLGYSEHDKGSTEQIPPSDIIRQTSFYVPEGVRLIVDSVSRSNNISKSKAMEFLTKSGVQYLDHLNKKYPNINKCSVLIKEIYETSLDTKIKQSHDSYVGELEKRFDFSVDKKGSAKYNLRIIWWVFNAIGKYSELLCLQRTDVLTIIIYYSAYTCKKSVSEEFKNKCKNDLINLESYLYKKNNDIIEMMSESIKKNIIGEIAIKGTIQDKHTTVLNNIKAAYPEVYKETIENPFSKITTKTEEKKKETDVIEVNKFDKNKSQSIEPVSKTIILIAGLVDQGKILDFDVVLSDESVLSYKRKRKNNRKNIKEYK